MVLREEDAAATQQALAAARFPDRIELNRERAMRVIRARNLFIGLSLLLATGCTSGGGFSSASMPSWWPWGKKTPSTPETGLADTGYPQTPAQQAQQGQVGPSYGPPAYGYPQTDPALAYGNPTYGNTAASYTGAPPTPTAQYAAAPPAYNNAGLYDPNAAAAYTQQGYGAPQQGYGAPQYPASDPSQPGGNVAMQNQYYNPEYARAAQPAAADPSAAAYGYPAAAAPGAYSDPNYAAAQPAAGGYPAGAYPATPSPTDASGAPAPQYGGAAAYTADTRSAAPGATGAPASPEMQGAGGYPVYAPSADGTVTGGSAWSNSAAPTAPTAGDPTMNQPPGQTGYAPGQNGYQPSGTSAYQAPAPQYQSNPNATAPAAGGARGATPYRPGSTGDYRSSGAATFRAATPGGEYIPSAGVAPASYEAASAPEAPATVTP